jgi:hypothetical protein
MGHFTRYLVTCHILKIDMQQHFVRKIQRGQVRVCARVSIKNYGILYRLVWSCTAGTSEILVLSCRKAGKFDNHTNRGVLHLAVRELFTQTMACSCTMDINTGKHKCVHTVQATQAPQSMFPYGLDCCFYGLNYAFVYACFYDTAMGHYTWYLIPCIELSLYGLDVGMILWFGLCVCLCLFLWYIYERELVTMNEKPLIVA